LIFLLIFNMNDTIDPGEIINEFKDLIDRELIKLPQTEKAPLFYDPIYYINRLQGKRLRPLLTMICAAIYDCPATDSIFSATAIEILHNFTLVHDDIMDNDDTRRGKPTVHTKWDVATAILAGDGLLGLSYRKLFQSPKGNLVNMANAFTETMIEICEGQALDKSFETSDQVQESDYLEMIRKKTAVLIQLSCQMGGFCAELNPDEIQMLAEYGYNIGMGFQIQDDILDIFADEDWLGKKVGRDLERNKKTIFTVNFNDQNNIPRDLSEFRKNVTDSGLLDKVKSQSDAYFQKAEEIAGYFPDNVNKKSLIFLTNFIKNRKK